MEKKFENHSTQSWLEHLLAEKIKKNPMFSLRAFARLVDIGPAVLSRVLSGKRKLTFNMAVRIADALALGPIERETLYSFYLSGKASDEDSLKNKTEKELSIDCFNAMKEWYHYGITQLLYLEAFKEDPKRIQRGSKEDPKWIQSGSKVDC